jgi:SAM-dependent methyltransferase
MDPPPQWQLLRLMDGFVVTQLLYVATQLGIAEALQQGPRTGTEIAEAVGADPGAITRVLRGLALEDVVSEQDGRFALTPVGELLPALAGSARVRGELYYHGAEGLLDAVKQGGTAFERTYGAPFFEHLARNPGHEAAFDASMAGRAQQEASAVVAAYDFTPLHTLVDVGGGRGALLKAILQAAPALQAVLVDRSQAVAAARQTLGERAQAVEGDFFATIPDGADAYVLSRILHDWHDDDARRILRVCHEAMRPDSKLIIVDAILPEHAKDEPGAIRMDLHMLLLFGARERTEPEFRALLAEAGFTLQRAIPTGSPAGLGVLEAVRAP